MCNAQIKIDLTKNTADLYELHSNECLERSFGKKTILPSINLEIKKRDDIIN